MITYGTRVAIVRRERLSAGRLAEFQEAHPTTAAYWFSTRELVKVGLTGKVSMPLKAGKSQYYLVRLDGFPAYGQRGTVLVKSFEIEQENKMSDTFQQGQRVRVIGLNFGCFTAIQLSQSGAFSSQDTPRRKALVGQTVEIVGRVKSTNYPDVEAYFVRSDRGRTVFLARELEAVTETPAETPAETTASDFEALVLELLTIFPNDEPGDVLDQSSRDSDPKDVATANRVVPALRALLRNHPTEVARRKARKTAQAQLRRELRQAEQRVESTKQELSDVQNTLRVLTEQAEALRAKLD